MNIDIFLTARTGSTRLPNKMLMPIMNKPIIAHLIDRIRRSKEARNIILCTTTLKEDDILEQIAGDYGILAFRGSENDVLERYRKAAEQYGTDFIITVDGDDIFCEPLFIDNMIDTAKSEKFDFIQFEGLPYGTFPYGMKTSALNKVCEIKDENDTSGWGKYFTKTNMFKVKTISIPKEYRHEDYRFTIDYAEDLKLAEEITKKLYSKKASFDINDIYELLEKEPELLEINKKQIDIYKKHFDKYSEVKLKK